MSAYDDAVAYLDAEVYRRCDYDIYSDMRDIVDEMEAENARLRTAVATAIRVQTVLCGDASVAYCRESCPLHRQETDDCVACDVIRVAHEFGICEGEE